MTQTVMTMQDAEAKLDVPFALANINTIQDGQKRLREMLNLAKPYVAHDPAPEYVIKAVRGLESWIEHAAR